MNLDHALPLFGLMGILLYLSSDWIDQNLFCGGNTDANV